MAPDADGYPSFRNALHVKKQPPAQWIVQGKYLVGVAVLLALAVAQTVAIVAPCGFKWGLIESSPF
jgi:hypothetical protein